MDINQKHIQAPSGTSTPYGTRKSLDITDASSRQEVTVRYEANAGLNSQNGSVNYNFNIRFFDIF